jgi:hypothetical protein
MEVALNTYIPSTVISNNLSDILCICVKNHSSHHTEWKVALRMFVRLTLSVVLQMSKKIQRHIHQKMCIKAIVKV